MGCGFAAQGKGTHVHTQPQIHLENRSEVPHPFSLPTSKIFGKFFALESFIYNRRMPLHRNSSQKKIREAEKPQRVAAVRNAPENHDDGRRSRRVARQAPDGKTEALRRGTCAR